MLPPQMPSTSLPGSLPRYRTPAEVRIRLLRDRIHQGWILTVLWVIDTGVTAATLEHTRAGSAVSGGGMIMESGRIGAEIAPLAAVLRADPPLCALANDGNLASIRALSAPPPPQLTRSLPG